MKMNSFSTAAIASFAAFSLVACSGGGGSPSPTPVPTPTPTSTPTASELIWKQGVFESASVYDAKCQTPHTGYDVEGNPFIDVQGELLHELFWLRSWTHETYLWNDEVIDRDPAGYDDRLDYFNVLKTEETTASGAAKDNFHFSQSTEEYLEQRNAAPSSGYGAQFAVFANVPPRDVRVVYTNPDTPASTAVNGVVPFIRGSKILEIDGVDMINDGSSAGVDVLNAGLFPAEAGETHVFVVEDPDGAQRTVSITSEDVPVAPVNRTAILDTSTGKAGYILFTTFSPFSSEEAIAGAISEMKDEGVDELILDLRYNDGGLLAVASQLAFMIAGPDATESKDFERLKFNDDAGNSDPVGGGVNEPVPFYDIGLGFSLIYGTPLESLDLDRVFILTTGNTCSASESVINGLRGVDVEVVLIGDTTCGKPYGFVPTDNCGETYYTIQFQGQNDKGFGDYADGFAPEDSNDLYAVQAPGCSVADDFENELGAPEEGLLSTALSYIENGACPAPISKVSTTSTKSASAKPMLKFQKDLEGAEIASTDLTPGEYIHRNNRDLRGAR